MASLQSLCMLNLSDNPTLGPTLPDDLAALPSLATLHCNNCGLQSLPDALGGRQQPKLSALSVSGNALTHLPHGLACAGALVVLKASNNQLSQLQGSMVKGWTALKELDVAHNKLEVRVIGTQEKGSSVKGATGQSASGQSLVQLHRECRTWQTLLV